MNSAEIKAKVHSYVLGNTVSLFCTVLFCGIASFLICITGYAILSPSDIGSLFGWMSDVVFTDHFWSIMASLDHPYTKYEVIYPALINEVYEVMGHICEACLTADTGNLEQDMLMSQIPLTLCLGFLLVGISAMLLVARKLYGEDCTGKKDLLFLMLLFTTPMYAAITAGNCIMYSVLFSSLFLLGYNSENKYIRFASYFSIAIAACIKMTPALLALLLIRERRIKDFAICFLLALALYIMPFIFTDGTPLDMLYNILNLPPTTGGSISNIAKLGITAHELTGIYEMERVFSVLSYVVALVVVILVILDRNSPVWVIILMLCCTLVVGPGVGTRYLCLNLIPSLMIFFKNEKQLTKTNIVISVCLGIAFMMLPSDFAIVPTFAVLILLGMMIRISVKTIISQSKGHESNH